MQYCRTLIFVESPQVMLLKVNTRIKDRSVSYCGKKAREKKCYTESRGRHVNEVF